MSENPEIITHEGRRFVRTGESGPVHKGDWFLSWLGKSIHQAKEFSPHPYEHLRELPAEPSQRIAAMREVLKGVEVTEDQLRELRSGEAAPASETLHTKAAGLDARYTIGEESCGCIIRSHELDGVGPYILYCSTHRANADLLRLLGEAEKALTDNLERGCFCKSSHEKDWHSPHCPIPQTRSVLSQIAARKERQP